MRRYLTSYFILPASDIMKINRHNYEEYFILYADKELNSDDRRMVEEFVLLNPDLKDELDIYQSAVLPLDTATSFDNKEELYHYDESLISYIDDELSADEKLQLEELINASPKLQQELDLYKKTKLQPDTDIVFEDKSVLYRTTERRRVVSMTIIRWSVAAAILLAISITAVNILNNKSAESIAGFNSQKINQTKTSNNTAASDIDNKQESQDDKNDAKDQINKPQTNTGSLAQSATKQKPLIKEKKIELIPIEEKQKENIANNNQPSNDLPTPQNNPNIIRNNTLQKNNNAVALVNDPQKTNGAVTSGNQQPLDNQKKIGENKSESQFASLTSEEGGQNKKSRGLFRKLTRVLEKNTGIKATDDDGEKLHIAAFTVKLK